MLVRMTGLTLREGGGIDQSTPGTRFISGSAFATVITKNQHRFV